MVVPGGNRKISRLVKDCEFAAVGIRAADALPQIASGLRFVFVEHEMPPREVAVSFNRARSGGRDRLEQAIILFDREMLEHHAWQRGRRLARFARRVLFILPVLLQLLRLRRHQPRRIRQEAQRGFRRASVAAGTRVIARIQQDQAQHVIRAIDVRHRQRECAGRARDHGLFRQSEVLFHIANIMFHTMFHGDARRAVGSAFRIDTPWEFAADAFDLGIVEPALEVMVAERHSPRHAAVGKRVDQLFDGGSHQFAGVFQCGRIAFPGRFGRCGCRTRVPATLAGGQRVCGIISGDLVAVENNKIGACGVKRGLDEADGVFADFRPVLDVGELQYAEFAGLVELQAAKPCGYGKRSTVPLFRWLDARARGFGGMLQFGHTSRVMQHWAITCAIHAGRQQIALPHRVRQNPSTHRPKRREQTGAKNKKPSHLRGLIGWDAWTRTKNG